MQKKAGLIADKHAKSEAFLKNAPLRCYKDNELFHQMQEMLKSEL